MRTVDRYVLRQVAKYGAAIFAFILVALLLERTLAILGELGPSRDLPNYLINLILNRAPEVIGIALPAAFFGGALLAFLRLNRERELDALNSSGVGLHQLIVPVFALAVVVSLLTFAVLGFLRPYGIYQYRSLVHQAKQTSLIEIFKIGTFVHAKGRTFYVKDWSRGADDLGEVFIFERDKDGDMNVTTAKRGVLTSSQDQSELMMIARDGQRVTIENEGGIKSILSFENVRWPLYSLEETPFRPRGGPESEKTIVELWHAQNENLAGDVHARTRAEFHQRLAHILSVLFMPFVAVPLALARSLIGQSLGLAAGVVIIVAIDQGILVGETLAAQEVLSPWIGIWGTVGCLVLVGLIFFPLLATRVAGDVLPKPFSGSGAGDALNESELKQGGSA